MTVGEGPSYQTNLVFYVVTELIMLLLLRLTTRRPVEQLSTYVALGLTLGALPPILDGFFFREPNVRYTYFSEFSWWMVSERQPLGETVVSWATIALAAAFAGWMTRTVWPAVVTAVGTYVVAQGLGTGLRLSVVALVPERTDPGGITHHLFMLGIALLALVAVRPNALFYSLKRAAHGLPFASVTTIGARLGGDDWTMTWVKSSLTLLACILVIGLNDWYDRHQDAAVETPRSMEVADVQLLAFLQLVLALSVAWLLAEALLGLVLLLTMTLAYHHPVTRLKRWVGVGYAIEGLAALGCLLIGVVRSHFPFVPRTDDVFFALIWIPVGFFLCSPFKDYKDVTADNQAGIQTLYTLLLSRGFTPRHTHYLVAFVLTSCLLGATAFAATRDVDARALTVLAILAVTAGLSLLVGSPKRAMGRTLWVISGSLVLLAFEWPSSSTEQPRTARYPTTPPCICRSAR